MKTVIKILPLFAAQLSQIPTGHAQQAADPTQTQIDAYTFCVAGDRFVRTSGCAPGSAVQLYSHSTGGVLLQTLTADEQGHSVTQLPIVTYPTPAFMLNRKDQAGYQTGTGRLARISEDDFRLSLPGIVVARHTAHLSWKATIFHSNYRFEIIKTNAGVSVTLADIQCPATSTEADFKCIDPAWAEGDTYTLRVVHAARGTVYEIPVSMQGKPAAWLTANRAEIRISLPSDWPAESGVQVFDVSGRAVYEVHGSAQNCMAPVDVSGWAQGLYTVVFTGPQRREAIKVIR